MSPKKRKRKSKLGQPTQAELADTFHCYQESVQAPDRDVEFFEQAFRDAYGRRPYSLREDFCGTFAVCCEWISTHKKRIAVGVDLCGDSLRWGQENNLSKLSRKERSRFSHIQGDVRSIGDMRHDVLAAQNFSFWIFKKRSEVIEYFRIARDNLKPEGVMVLDMMGGGACYEERNIDKRKIGKGKKSFHYEWEQARFNPITRDAEMHIHFSFRDGSRLDKAFTYDWRFWTLPEVREMLTEAGFRESHVYWSQEGEDGEDTGEYERVENTDSIEAWICYVVGVK